MLPEVKIQLLGGLRLVCDGSPASLPASKKTRALLGYLVLNPGPHTRSQLCDLLWDGPADPRAALRWSLTKLRPLVDVGQPRILADRRTVALEVSTLSVDVFQVERERLRNLRIGVLSDLTQCNELPATERLAVAREWVQLEPLDELAHARLVNAHVASGHLAEAQRAAGACQRLFERELGRPPGALLERALANQEPEGPEALELQPAALPTFKGEHPSGLFGRAAECVAIENHLGRIGLAGGAPLLWFEGEAGIGKTRLLDELAQRASKRSLALGRAKAFESEGLRTMAIWSDLLGGLPSAADAPARPKLFERLLSRIKELRSPAGLVLAFDDLQWIDEGSASLLAWLVRRRLDWLLIAASARPGELEDNPAAKALERALASEGLIERHVVPPLAEAEVRALITSIAPGTESEDTVRRTGGNPLFAILLASSTSEDHATELSRTIAERLGRLAERELELLRVAAALGGSFTLELLADVSGLPPGGLIALIERLERAGILMPRAGGELDFAHDLLRDAIYDGLSDPARRLIHRRIARRLGEDAAAGRGAAQLARQAGLAGEDELAARASVAAGRECIRLAAQADALRHARRATHHVLRLEGRTARGLLADCLWIEVHAGLGRRDRVSLRARLLELAESATRKSEHDTAREALYLLSIVDEEAGDFEHAQEWTLAAAEEGLRGDSATRTKALANTGRCLAQLGRRLEEAERFLQQAADADELAPVDLPWGLGLLAAARGDFDEAERQLEQAFEAALDTSSSWAAFECQSRLVLVELARGAPEAALRREARLRASARRLSGGSELALTEALLALAHYLLEEPTPASKAAFDKALAGLRAQDSKAILSSVLNQAAEADLTRGQRETALVWAEEALEAASAVGREQQLARARSLLQDAQPHQP